jgi:hypothetical protein
LSCSRNTCLDGNEHKNRLNETDDVGYYASKEIDSFD